MRVNINNLLYILYFDICIILKLDFLIVKSSESYIKTVIETLKISVYKK